MHIFYMYQSTWMFIYIDNYRPKNVLTETLAVYILLLCVYDEITGSFMYARL